jgi:hypothetical protein
MRSDHCYSSVIVSPNWDHLQANVLLSTCSLRLDGSRSLPSFGSLANGFQTRHRVVLVLVGRLLRISSPACVASSRLAHSAIQKRKPPQLHSTGTLTVFRINSLPSVRMTAPSERSCPDRPLHCAGGVTAALHCIQSSVRASSSPRLAS